MSSKPSNQQKYEKPVSLHTEEPNLQEISPNVQLDQEHGVLAICTLLQCIALHPATIGVLY